MNYLVTKKNAKYFEEILDALSMDIINENDPRSAYRSVMKTAIYKKHMQPAEDAMDDLGDIVYECVESFWEESDIDYGYNVGRRIEQQADEWVESFVEPDLRWPQDGEDIIELVFGNFARIVLDMDIDERFMQYGR